RPRGICLDIQVLAFALQPGRIDEGGQFDLAYLDAGAGGPRLGDRDRTVPGDFNLERVVRDVDGWLNGIAARRDKLTVLIHLQSAVPGISLGAVRHFDLQKAAPLNRYIQ